MVVPVLTASWLQSRCRAAGPGPPQATTPAPFPAPSPGPIQAPAPSQAPAAACAVTAAIFSRDLGEAKRRVRELYRAWYREVPNTVHLYQLDITVRQARDKLRELFVKNAHVTDPRVIDMLVIKGNT